MSVIGKGSIGAGRVFCTVARAVSEEPHILFAFFFLCYICYAMHVGGAVALGRGKEQVGGILYSDVHRSNPNVLVVKIIYKWMKTASPM